MECHTEGDVANIVADARIRILELERRLAVREQDLRRSVRRPTALAQLLQEDFAQHDIALVAEHGAENDRHTVGLSLNVHRLLVAVVDHSSLVALLA